MAKLKIVTTPFQADGYPLEREALAGLDVEIVEAPAEESAFLAAAQDADAIYAKGLKITRRIIDGLTKCRVITLGSVGVDSVDIAAATERNIPVTNIPDTFIEEVADHTMTLLLASWRRLPESERLVRDKRWGEGRRFLYQFPRLRGLTLGFISFGRIPRAVSRRAAPFGLRMMAYDPFIEEFAVLDYGVEPAPLNDVLEQSDFICMHAPGTPESDRMMRAEHFARMKKTAIFINTGRGQTVDEAALIEALQQGKIAGAALDVLEKEPPGDNNPLLSMDNVILTAHVASASSRFDPARKRRVGQELALVLKGKWPMSCVNPAALEKSGLARWQPISILRGPNS
ncbi:C-terminal binding protein [Muricoccus radiodurans]|uniref:C-terminal binding protein n=1 Tax=Muricoccus radiodurans TaxID=2231721 RepID=UPI003CE6EF6F